MLSLPLGNLYCCATLRTLYLLTIVEGWLVIRRVEYGGESAPESGEEEGARCEHQQNQDKSCDRKCPLLRSQGGGAFFFLPLYWHLWGYLADLVVPIGSVDHNTKYKGPNLSQGWESLSSQGTCNKETRLWTNPLSPALLCRVYMGISKYPTSSCRIARTVH